MKSDVTKGYNASSESVLVRRPTILTHGTVPRLPLLRLGWALGKCPRPSESESTVRSHSCSHINLIGFIPIYFESACNARLIYMGAWVLYWCVGL